MKRNHPADTWPEIPGVSAHLARTGEVCPPGWAMTPADMLHHGGYAAVSEDGREVDGPFCWAENARRAAAKIAGGRVVTWRRRMVSATTTRNPALHDLSCPQAIHL